MFQDGGFVRGSQLPTSFGQSQQNTYTFEPTENPDTVIYVEIDQDGNRVSEVPVDLTLSATRNPSEAFNRQLSEQKLSRIQTGILALPLFRGVGTAFNLAKAGLQPILKRIPALTIRQRDTLAGPGTTTTLTNPNQIIGLTETGKNVALGLGGLGGIAGIETLKPGPVDIQQELTDLQTKPDKLSGKLFDQPKKEEPEGPKVDPKFKDQPLVSKVISSPDFNRFLSNLSSSLTDPDPEKGTTAERLASAPSKSFEQKLQGINNVVSIETSDAERNRKVNQEILGNINEFEQTERNLSRLDYAISLVDEGATGLSGLFGKGWTDFLALFNKNSSTPFGDLDPRTQADRILTALRQQDIRNILGESGRTISNLDREIVAEIFGSIKVTSTPAEIKEALREIGLRYRKGLKRNRNEILAGIDYFNQTGMPSSVLEGNVGGLSTILSIQDFDNYKAPTYDPGSEGYGEYVGGNITDIEYVEGT